MARNLIEHCGRKIPTVNKYLLMNWPRTSNETHIFQATCKDCNLKVFAYRTFVDIGGGAKRLIPTEQADNYFRNKFQEHIAEGRAVWMEPSLDEIPKDARAKSLSSEYERFVKGDTQEIYEEVLRKYG